MTMPRRKTWFSGFLLGQARVSNMALAPMGHWVPEKCVRIENTVIPFRRAGSFFVTTQLNNCIP